MTAKAKPSTLNTVIRVVGFGIILVTFIAACFAAYYGLETSAHASSSREVLRDDIATRETKEHATDQHKQLNQRITDVQTQQTAAFKRVEDALQTNNDRLWELVKHKRRNGDR